MQKKARPTLRCLFDDLGGADVEDAAQRSALAGGSPRSIGPLPLDAIEHPLLKASNMFVDRTPEDVHDLRIKAVTDRTWYKARSGRRMRGAVWIDEEGVPWLCAAGTRREGEIDDFYAWFEGQSASGSQVFLPTEEDRKRLRLERVHAADAERLVELGTRVAEALATAARAGEVTKVALPTSLDPETLEFRDGASLVLELTPGDAGTVGEITLSLEVSDYATTQYGDVILEVRRAIPGIPTADWDVVPAMGDHSDPCWYALVDEEWVNCVLTSIEAEGPRAFAERPPDLTHGSDGMAHIVPTGGLVEAMVEGQPVRGLCGRCFVPRADPDERPVCADCVERQRTLDLLWVAPG